VTFTPSVVDLDELTVRFMDNPVQLREYEAGNMDVIFAPISELDRLRADTTLRSELSIVPGLCSQAWGFNTQKAPFDNVHIRRAFTYASDSIYNYGHWQSAEFDQLVDQARLLTDPAERRALYAQAEQLMIVDEAGTMPLYWPR
jgi:ABC-type oligopeptide transport system substrate-binding subunit